MGLRALPRVFDGLALECGSGAATQITQYDLLLATGLDPGAPVPGSHDYDPAFRALVDQHIHQHLKTASIPHLRVTNDDRSRAEAVQEALAVVAQGTLS